MPSVLTFARPPGTRAPGPTRAGAEVVDITKRRAAALLDRSVVELRDVMRTAAPPDPTAFGWTPVAEDADGIPTRYMHFHHGAMIGEIPGQPGMVFLDYRHRMIAYSGDLPELALGLETGCLPPPLGDVDESDDRG